MNNKLLLLITFLGMGFIAQAQFESRYEYIDRFKDIAMREMERTGIPASIKLGQGILESAGGTSTLARKANNHFGIKCHNDWNGKGYYLEDDDYDENGNLIKSCFRVYKNADASYVAHSEFLRDPKKRFRYGFLFNLDPFDYKAWARGLKRAGYATSPTYAEKLIRIIETYQLYRYDVAHTVVQVPDLEGGGTAAGGNINNFNISKINGVKVILARAGEQVSDVAVRSDTKTKCIIKFNDRLDDGSDRLQENTRVYLQRKRRNYRGRQKWHYVRKGETLFGISQLYGISLKHLYRRNRIKEGQQPATGERVKLKGWKVSVDNRPLLSKEVFTPDRPNTEGGNEEDFLFEEDPNEEEDFGNDFEIEIPNEGGSQGGNQTSTPMYHIVERGDTLYSIARRYNTRVETIMLLNNMNNTLLNVGQRLRVK
ncbi:MAG: glucosaminidase domain-containing protein [Bacteroidota bacterium]